MVTVVQLSTPETNALCTLNGWIVQYTHSIPIKLLLKKLRGLDLSGSAEDTYIQRVRGDFWGR